MHRWMPAAALEACSVLPWSVASQKATGLKTTTTPEHRFAHARPCPKAAAYPIKFFCCFLSLTGKKKKPNECHRLLPLGVHRWGRGGTGRDLACFLGQLFRGFLSAPKSLPRFTVAGAAGVQDRGFWPRRMTRLPFSVSISLCSLPTVTNSATEKAEEHLPALIPQAVTASPTALIQTRFPNPQPPKYEFS